LVEFVFKVFPNPLGRFQLLNNLIQLRSGLNQFAFNSLNRIFAGFEITNLLNIKICFLIIQYIPIIFQAQIFKARIS
jgi:hypothetical protein